jgi:hypothetical protein
MASRMIRAAAALAAGLGLALAGAATAAADTSDSSNWAGYAVHRSGVRFRKVVGSWTQPEASCSSGHATYSSVWVGIGGYSVAAPALEQIGTELDCTASGRAVSTAWYELVPAASRTIGLTVNPGDRLQASVVVSGREVTLQIADLTRHRSFVKRLRATVLDVTSAEWIVEAPSECTSVSDCHTLPLADFGTAAISGARATTTAGHAGAITDRRWTTSKISLVSGSRRFVAGPGSSSVLASPSALAAGGLGFTVTYKGSGSSGVAPAVARAGTRIVHAGR